MSYTVRNAEGQPVAGEKILSQDMKDYTDQYEGFTTVNEATGETVYPEEG